MNTCQKFHFLFTFALTAKLVINIIVIRYITLVENDTAARAAATLAVDLNFTVSTSSSKFSV